MRLNILQELVEARAESVAIIPEDWAHVDAGTRVRAMMLDWTGAKPKTDL